MANYAHENIRIVAGECFQSLNWTSPAHLPDAAITTEPNLAQLPGWLVTGLLSLMHDLRHSVLTQVGL